MIRPSLACRACSRTCSSLHLENTSRLLLQTSPRRHTKQWQSQRSRFHSTSHLASKNNRITYRIAVASSGKNRPFHPVKNAYDFNPAIHDALGVTIDDGATPAFRRKNRPDSGEDAWFVSKIGHAVDPGTAAFAVADGVGGWSESRVDPADFSHALCRYMAGSAVSWPSEKSGAGTLRAKNLLQMGYDRVVNDGSVRAGGSTASVGVASDDGHVELANLGDSGSVLLRLAAVHHYSVPQTHGFNTPYQLSIIPPRMRTQAEVFGGAFLEDFPRDAATTNVRMQHGDVLLLATDGVFDNLNNQDILKTITSRMVVTGAWQSTPNLGIGVSDSLEQFTGPDGLASLMAKNSASHAGTGPADKPLTLQALLAASIARDAKLASIDLKRDGPFAKEAQRYYPGDHYRGGKVDDITCLIVVAVEEGHGR